MKKTIALFILIIICQTLRAQILSDNDYRSLLPALQSGEWKTAFRASDRLLRKSKPDTSDNRARILYVKLFSAAAMVSEKQMTFRELNKHIKNLIDQKLITAYHQVSYDTSNVLGYTSIESNDTINQTFTASCNSTGTSIYLFEICRLRNRVDLADYPEGAMLQCGGRIENIEANPNDSNIWIMSVTLKDGFVRKDD